MKNIFLLILIVITLKSVGQNNFVGIKGGVNSTNVTTSNFLSHNDDRNGLSFGLIYEYQFKKHFSFGADLVYNQRGFSNEMIFADNLGIPTGEKFTYKNNYDYVSLPIKTGFNYGNKVFGFVNFGAIPSFLVNAKSIIPTLNTNGKITGNEEINLTSRVTKFDIAGFAEIGIGYKLMNRYWLFSSFVYQNSFTTITNAEYFAESKISHNGMMLTIGLKLAL